MDISAKSIVCTTLDRDGSIVRKDDIENSFGRLGEFLDSFAPGDKFVMESTGFYEPLYDFIESRGLEVKLANPLKVKLIAESRMKNDDVDWEILAKLLRNDWIPKSYVPPKEIDLNSRVLPPRYLIQGFEDFLLLLRPLKFHEISILVFDDMELLKLQDHPFQGILLHEA